MPWGCSRPHGEVGSQVYQEKGGDTHQHQKEKRGTELHPGGHEQSGC